jgi:DNA-binding transcriptional LysR family regulator
MELRQLQYFVAVAEELHFGRAAERLHIVQPAVSQQLRRLEQELGVRLVDRSTRRVALTPAGERFLPEARAVLAAAARARDSVGTVRTLRLGTSTGLGARLPRLLAEFERRTGGAAIELVRVPAAARLRRVADGTLDAALVRGVTGHPGLRVEPVWTDPIVVALAQSHPLAAERPLRLAALEALPVRLPARGENAPLVDLVTGACRAAGFEPRVEPALNEQDMLAAIAAGPPSWTVFYAAQADALAATGIAFREPQPSLRMPTALAMPATQTPALDALLAACRALTGPP